MVFAKNISNNVYIRMAVIFLVYVVYLKFNAYQDVLYYDALDYWVLSGQFFKNGQLRTFSFLNFNDTLRGYLFPLLNLPANILASVLHLKPLTAAKILGAVWASVLFGCVLPLFWNAISRRKQTVTWGSFLVLLASSFLFWRDYFTFTLTDFPAFTVFLSAFLFINKRSKISWLLAGILMAAALNFRPVYFIVFPFFVLLAFLILYRQQFINWIRLPLFFLGAALVVLPQFIINSQNFGKNSPLVLGTTPKYANLYQWHLAWGMRIQKFETLYPNTKIPLYVADDPAGVQLLQKVNNGQSFASMGDYIASVLHHPFEFTGLYGRHLFNQLDIKYPTPFILNPDFYWITSVINYSLLFCGLLLLLRLPWRKSLVNLLGLGALLAVIVVSLPVVPECRFALPLHILLLTAVAFSKPLPVWWRFLHRRRLSLNTLAAYLVWLVVCLAVSSTTQSLTSLKQVFHY